MPANARGHSVHGVAERAQVVVAQVVDGAVGPLAAVDQAGEQQVAGDQVVDEGAHVPLVAGRRVDQPVRPTPLTSRLA